MSNGYVESLSEALPDLQRVQEEKARLESLGVKYVFSCWIDMFGIPKTKPVRVSSILAVLLWLTTRPWSRALTPAPLAGQYLMSSILSPCRLNRICGLNRIS